MAGARWVQTDVLARHAGADVRGFAAWFPMYPGDARTRWRGDLLTDSRVVQRWDQPKTVGRFFLEHLAELKPRGAGGTLREPSDALWDAYLLYDASATWTGVVPQGLYSWGATILKTKDRLATDLGDLAARPTARPRVSSRPGGSSTRSRRSP